MNCSTCGSDVKPSQSECPNCGAVLERTSLQLPACLNCGTQNPLEARYCLQCGRALIEEVSEAKEIPKHPTSEEFEPKPPASSEPVVLSPPIRQKQPASGVKTSSITVVIGGFFVVFCLCVICILGYGIVRSIGDAPLPVDTVTQTVLIPPAKTKIPATKRPTMTVFVPTFTAVPTVTDAPTNTPRPTATVKSSQPFGKIVFSCQMDGEVHDQVCIVNADGTGWRQLTDNGKHNWYASISPDGQSVVYSSNMTGNNYEIYEISVRGSNLIQLTSRLGGKLYAPEISPDGKKIVFTYDDNNFQSIWVMNRDGSNPRRVSPDDGWDPSWSADGKSILFASLTSGGTVQLFTMNESGANVKQVSDMSGLVGRSDLSPTGEHLATYAGKYGSRSIYLIPLNGATAIKYFFDPTSAAPSFSPDGQWMAFTGYIDHSNDFEKGCEIYIVRLDDPSNPIRLTDNNYCDWQPRWGP